MPALSGAEQQLVPRIVGIARLTRVHAARQQQLHNFRVARAHGLVNGKLIPMLSVDQSPVFREERLHLRQVAERAGLEERPGVVTVQLLDAINVSPRLHLLGLCESGVVHSQSRLTIVLRQGGPSAFNCQQRRNPAPACSTLVGPDVHLKAKMTAARMTKESSTTATTKWRKECAMVRSISLLPPRAYRNPSKMNKLPTTE